MSNSFNEANQAKLSLKMMLQWYSWMKGVLVSSDKEGYAVTVMVDEVTDAVRKIVPVVHQNVSVNLEQAK